ncbi:MAG: XdhC family protein [Thermoplasmataceae archaeon]
MRNWEYPEFISELVRKGQRFVVATVVKVSGSSIGKPGFRTVISSDGKVIYGTLGGACPDSVIIEKAKQVMSSGEARTVKVFLESTEEALKGVMINKDDEIHVETFCGGIMDIFLEPFFPSERLVIIGQGGRDEIEENLVRLGKMVDMQVVVVDPNPMIEVDPDISVNSAESPLSEFKFSEGDYVVMLTKGANDIPALEMLSHNKTRYVGMLASRKRIEADREILIKKGVPESFMESLHAPVGIDIGSITPAEIALSIISEITSIRRKKTDQ